jgi:monothiol glutaredoxin
MTTPNSTEVKIDKIINTNKVVVFIKGNKLWPECGYSATALDILNAAGIKYEIVNILKEPELRRTIKTYKNWPTFPQIYINGELIGGSDILKQLYKNGTLSDLLQK